MSRIAFLRNFEVCDINSNICNRDIVIVETDDSFDYFIFMPDTSDIASNLFCSNEMDAWNDHVHNHDLWIES